MRIKELIKSLDSFKDYPGLSGDFRVRGVTCDSKAAKEDFVFVAIKGSRQDGNRFIDQAIAGGAKAVVVGSSKFKVQSSKKAVFIKVKDTRKALAKLAVSFYGDPSQKLKVIGITGTNGKTTVSYLMESLLKEARYSPAVIGTINYRFGNKIIPSKNTTPGPIQLQSMLADMLKAGIDYAIMEVSSHALHQDRTEGINFSSAIFTNLTQDHLDYHKTLQSYFCAKAKLFKNMGPGSFVVINNDDKYARRLKRITKAEILTYGIENKADVMAQKIKFGLLHSEFRITSPRGKLDLKVRLIGRHNVYNILAALSWALKEGIDTATIKSAIEKFSLVPGRLERVECKGGFSAFVDYAHTEDALKNVIRSLRQISAKRIIVVFGCGGERDKTKRPKMGRVVSELADYAIITNDNPRSEDPQKIINDITKGIRNDSYCVIPKRYEAIRKSLSMAKKGDIVLVAGKGHENYQITKDRKMHFDDRVAIRECLKSMNY